MQATATEGQAVRAVACVCYLAVCLGLVGCTTPNKKAPNQPAAPSRQPADWLPQSDNSSTSAPAQPSQPGLGGLLAGRVLDTYDRPPPPVYIQVALVQQSGGPKSAPQEVTTDKEGYFVIRGLDPGQHYELIARTREGGARLAGRTWATPPNPRLLIYVSEDYATPDTPAAPRVPALPKKEAAPAPSFPETRGNSAADPRASGATGPRGVDLGAPIRLNDPPSNPAAPPAVIPRQPQVTRPESITADESLARRDPPVSIRPQVSAPSLQTLPSDPPATAAPATPPPATRVPSCVLTGKQLTNFALADLSGRPWEFRNRRGKLVLLDFWGTWCVPCRNAIPHLKILQEKYGPAGLEIVGIAYEMDSLPEQLRKVQGVRDRMGIDYRLLLGSGFDTCPVKNQFGVRKFPTLVLIDDNGRIIWKEEGLDSYQLDYLEMLIRQQLGVR
jgi:thiol-disulfide isomerase/thioredoxin